MAVKLDEKSFAELINILHNVSNSIVTVREQMDATIKPFLDPDSELISGGDLEGFRNVLRELQAVEDKIEAPLRLLNTKIDEAAKELQVAFTFLNKTTEELAADMSNVTKAK